MSQSDEIFGTNPLQADIADIGPLFTRDTIEELTRAIIAALREHRCTLLKNKVQYLTDLPANVADTGSINVRGNSESEVGFPFDLGRVCQSQNLAMPAIGMNGLRMYGPVSDKNPLHFHGPAKPIEGQLEFTIFVVQMIVPFDSESGSMNVYDSTRHLTPEEWQECSPLILIVEQDGLVKKIEAHVGDLLVLPGGIFHEFTCLTNTFVSISSIEVASDVSLLGCASWSRAGIESAQTVIARTIYEETGEPLQVLEYARLTLADIPSLSAYIKVG